MMVTQDDGARVAQDDEEHTQHPRQASWSLKFQQLVETDGQTGVSPARQRPHGDEHTRHERGAVEAVRPDGQLLARVAEKDLLMGIQSA